MDDYNNGYNNGFNDAIGYINKLLRGDRLDINNTPAHICKNQLEINMRENMLNVFKIIDGIKLK